MSRALRATGLICTEKELIVHLQDHRSLVVPLEWFPRLESATPKQRSRWEIIGRGVGIHWPDVDEDISVAGLFDPRAVAFLQERAKARRKSPVSARR